MSRLTGPAVNAASITEEKKQSLYTIQLVMTTHLQTVPVSQLEHFELPVTLA